MFRLSPRVLHALARDERGTVLLVLGARHPQLVLRAHAAQVRVRVRVRDRIRVRVRVRLGLRLGLGLG